MVGTDANFDLVTTFVLCHVRGKCVSGVRGMSIKKREEFLGGHWGCLQFLQNVLFYESFFVDKTAA